MDFVYEAGVGFWGFWIVGLGGVVRGGWVRGLWRLEVFGLGYWCLKCVGGLGVDGDVY